MIDQQAVPERNDGEHDLTLDYQEIADIAHSPRCYYWRHWLGLVPLFHTRHTALDRSLHRAMNLYYSGSDRPEAAAGGVEPYIQDMTNITKFGRIFLELVNDPITIQHDEEFGDLLVLQDYASWRC